MCIYCWHEYGCPRIVNEKTRNAAKLVVDLYEESCAGGKMHVVTDDWNIEDSYIAYCRDQVQTKREKAVWLAFHEMSLSERASALAIEAGYFSA